MAHATLAQLRAHLGIQAGITTDDPSLSLALATAEEAVNQFCGRTFTVPAEDAADEERIYDGGRRRVLIDDFVTVTTVEQSYDRESWSERTDYWLEPANGDPKTTVASRLPFATWVRVTGVPGMTLLPPSVTQATLIKAARLFKRKDSPTGTEGSGDFGIVRITRFEDPDVVLLLTPFVRADVAMGIA